MRLSATKNRTADREVKLQHYKRIVFHYYSFRAPRFGTTSNEHSDIPRLDATNDANRKIPDIRLLRLDVRNRTAKCIESNVIKNIYFFVLFFLISGVAYIHMLNSRFRL